MIGLREPAQKTFVVFVGDNAECVFGVKDLESFGSGLVVQGKNGCGIGVLKTLEHGSTAAYLESVGLNDYFTIDADADLEG